MKKTQQRFILVIALLMIACITAGIFASCGGEPASQDSTTKKQTNTYQELEPPPTPTVITSPEIEDILWSETIKDNAGTPNKPVTAGSYAASSESNKYHRRGCYYVDNILPENLIYFSSEYAARQAGYSPCSVCDP